MSLIHTRGAPTRRFTAVLAVATAMAMPATASHAQATSSGSGGAVRARCSGCATSRDSVRKNRDQLLLRIDSLRWEFDHSRMNQVERERLAREMTDAVLSLQASLDEAGRASAYVTAIESEGAQQAAIAHGSRPVAIAIESGFRMRGYLGVSFDGPSTGPTGPDRIVRFYQYPKVALVDPSSPADRAGVLEGDTLVALNGTDAIEREFSFTKLLVPKSRVTLRVRREGNAKDLVVTVGEAPEYYVRRAMPMPPMTPMPPGMVAPARAPTPMERGEVRVRIPEAPMASRAPMAMGGGSLWIFNEGVAGAKVEDITEGLGRAVGAKSGVLVIRSQPGTIAYRAGLRDGDVILSAAGKDVISVRDLRLALSNGEGAEGVKLTILRERKRRDVTLHW